MAAVPAAGGFSARRSTSAISDERDPSGHFPCAPWRDRMEPVGPAHGSHRHAADRARRAASHAVWRTRLQGLAFAKVFTSPLQRAARTCALAGFGAVAEIDRDLVEWDYGDFEGLTTREIQSRRPGWSLFRDGCPGGESLADIGARADRVVQRARNVSGNVLIFSSGHILRVLAARWLGQDASSGRHFVLGTAALMHARLRARPVRACDPLVERALNTGV